MTWLGIARRLFSKTNDTISGANCMLASWCGEGAKKSRWNSCHNWPQCMKCTTFRMVDGIGLFKHNNHYFLFLHNKYVAVELKKEKKRKKKKKKTVREAVHWTIGDLIYVKDRKKSLQLQHWRATDNNTAAHTQSTSIHHLDLTNIQANPHTLSIYLTPTLSFFRFLSLFHSLFPPLRRALSLS